MMLPVIISQGTIYDLPSRGMVAIKLSNFPHCSSISCLLNAKPNVGTNYNNIIELQDNQFLHMKPKRFHDSKREQFQDLVERCERIEKMILKMGDA